MIWCVEDDASIREIEVYTLQSMGFTVQGFADAAAFWEAMKTQTPELVLLDVMLPGQDGFQVLKKLRANASTRSLPVIMATAKGMEYDKILGLDSGADDYLVKPFGMMELVSRVKAVLRRCNTKEATVLQAGGLSLNVPERTVSIDGERVVLTYKEFELLKLFLSHPGIAFTREALFNEVWGMDYCGETRTVDMHIRTLRQKLGVWGNRIATVRHVGYRLEDTHE